MRDFELDRPVDPVAIMSSNSSGPTVEPEFIPIAVVAWVYVVAAIQVAAGIAYWVAVGVSVKLYGSSSAE